MTSFTQEHRATVERLQAELQLLKEQHGGNMQMRKATDTATAPFPLVVTVSVPQPPVAANYDCDSLKIQVVLSATLVEQQADAGGLQGISVEIADQTLPQRLRDHIAQRLLHAHQNSRQGSDGCGFGLATIFEEAGRDFGGLLSSIPELVEAYEGTDAGGATVRRYAIIDEDQQVSMDTGVHTVSQRTQRRSQHETAQQPVRSAEVKAAAQPMEPAAPAAPRSSAPGAELAAAQAEVMWLRRRYGSGFQLHMYEGPEAARQGGAQPAAAQHQRQPGMELSVTLTPTDPSWDRGPLQLRIRLADSYPAAGSVTVTSAASCSDGGGSQACSGGADGSRTAAAAANSDRLSAGTGELLAKLLTAQAAADARRPAPLKAVVRSLENNAAQLVQQAEDMFLEVQRRRLAAAAVLGRRAGAATDSGEAVAAGAATGSNKGSVGDAAASAECPAPDTAAAPSAAPEVHPAALQPALSARRSFGQGLWWPGDSSSIGSGAALDAADGAVLSRGASDASSYFSGSGSGSGSDSGSGSSHGGSGSRDDSSDGGDLRDGQNGAAGGRAGAADRSTGDGGARTAVALELLDLAVDNVDVIEPHHLKLQVVCQRCQRRGEVELPAGEGGGSRRVDAAGSCAHCHHDWEVGVRGSLVHEHSVVLARLWPTGCTPTDLLPSLLAAQCGACSAVAALRGVQVGQPARRNCSQCHRAMQLQFAAFAFTTRAAASGSQQAKQQGRQRPAGGAASGGQSAAHAGPLEVGQPLPNLGTCSHYRHSHRWLRFPCCGQRFPCDLCHEEATDGHERKWATRMVCGFCSLEQPIGERCVGCGKRLASSAHKSLSGRPTRHWEGGKGERDPKRLDRRDKHKYRGSKAKTSSKKSSRVGQTGKKKKQRGEKG